MITLTTNTRKGGIELRFDDKPDEFLRERLKGLGWRWSRFAGCWYHQDTEAARRFAATLTEERASCE